jgi:hypothetical protein
MNDLPPIPEGCDAETYAVRWTQGYPLWFCEDEARAAAGEGTKRQQAHGRDWSKKQ